MSMDKRAFRYITEQDPEYRAHKEKLPPKKQERARAFGEREVEKYDARIASGENATCVLNELASDLGWLRRALAARMQSANPYQQLAAVGVLTNAKEDSQIREELFTAFGPDTEEMPPTKDIVAALQNDQQISNALFLKIIRRHTQSFQREAAAFEERKEALIEDFKQEVRDAIATGYIPISEVLLEERLEAVTVRLHDPLRLQHSNAEYDPVRSEVRIGSMPNESAAHEKRMLFHELTHVLAGRMYRSYEWGSGTERSVEQRRSGVKTPRGRFAWLHEAITEEVARYLAKHTGSGSYQREIDAMQRLKNTGIAGNVFRSAYFENYDPGDATPLSGWKELVETIDDKIGSAAFRDLNEQFSKRSYH